VIACRALEVDLRTGVRMAIDFLQDDPPLLFRLTVVDKMEETAGQDIAYDIDQPFAAPSNQEAIANLTRALGLE